MFERIQGGIRVEKLVFPVVWRDDKGQQVSGLSAFAHPFISIEVSGPDLRRWQRVEAMIDTGLSRTSINREILAAAGCVESGKVRLSGSAGWQDFATYQIDLRFPQFRDGVIEVHGAEVIHPLEAGGGLVGMDVLALGRLFLDPAGAQGYFELPLPTSNRPDR